MAYETKDNSGSLFRNDRKEQPNHPDYTGNGMIGGEEYWINAWLKESPTGKKYFSFAFRPKNPPSQQRQAQPATNGYDTMDDEIPF